MERPLLLALAVGLLQGVFEWLPVSSEANVTLFLVLGTGVDPAVAVRFALFLHAGTAIAAATYYRADLGELLAGIRDWRPSSAFDDGTAELSFFAVATLASAVVGAVAYRLMTGFVTDLTGGALVAGIGALLVATGLIQRVGGAHLGRRRRPTLAAALIVGALQGLAVLPGVSRSGTTVGGLLLGGYEEVVAFRLSFLLSIPAALGAGALVLLDGGFPAIAPTAALVALLVSAVVGYATIDALLRLVRRVPFWAVAVGLGTLAVVGGLVAAA